MFMSVILAVVCFLGFVAAHAFVFHRFKPQRRFRAIISLMSLSVVFYGLFFWLAAKAFSADPLVRFFSYRSVDALVGVLFYFFFLAFYYQLLVIFDRSLSVRMMADIYKRGEKGMTLDELKTSYSIEEKFRDEVRDMLFVARFRQEGVYLYNTGKGSFQARVIGFLRKYLNLAANR